MMADKYEERLEKLEMDIAYDLNTLEKMAGPAGKRIVDRIIGNMNEINGVFAKPYLELLREGKS